LPCATSSGDVNGDGDTGGVTDALALLTHNFFGDPPELAPLCARVSSAGLPDTGQTKCFDSSGVEIPCDSGFCPDQDGLHATGCPFENRFVDNGDGTVTDNCTGLMWQKDSADVNGNGQSTDEDNLTWCDALTYCENLRLAGHDDWRLPNVRELQSIVDYGRFGPSIDPVFGAFSAWYWSSTSHPNDPDYALIVDFGVGYVLRNDRDVVHHVRAVRSTP
jgi:hypothetical protein